MMNKLSVESGALNLMDKSYVAFEKPNKFFQQNGFYFVTIAKDNMVYEVHESYPIEKSSGIFR